MYIDKTNASVWFYEQDFEYSKENNFTSSKFVRKAYSDLELTGRSFHHHIELKTKDFGSEYIVDHKNDNKDWYESNFELEDMRFNPILIEIIEFLGFEAIQQMSAYAPKVVEIPDDVEYEIEEYDGIEWIAEKHRVWR